MNIDVYLKIRLKEQELTFKRHELFIDTEEEERQTIDNKLHAFEVIMGGLSDEEQMEMEV